VLQIAELKEKDGVITMNRDSPIHVRFISPKEVRR